MASMIADVLRRGENFSTLKMTKLRAKSTLSIVALLAFACIALAVEGQQAAPGTTATSPSAPEATTSKPGVLPIPYPNLSKVDELPKQQIQAGQSELQSVSQKAGVTEQQLAQAYGKLGKLYQAYEFWDAAIACYTNAHALAPQSFDWPYYLGRLYQANAQHQMAITYFKIAQQLRPNDTVTLLNLANTYLDQDQAEVAKPLFEKALALDKSSAVAMVGLGKIAFSGGDFAAAVKYFEAALALQPAASSIHYPLAMAYRRLGDVPKALGHLQKRGTVQPKATDPLIEELETLKTGRVFLWERGNHAMHEGRFAEAAEDYGKMVDLDKQEPLAKIYLGSALAGAGDFKAAIEQYTQALSLAPGNDMAHYNLGLVLIQTGSEGEAIEHFQAAIKSNPGAELSHFQLANLLMRNGRYEEALTHYATIIRMDPSHEFARLMESMALIRLRRYAEAKTRLEEGVAAVPDSVDIAIALARLLAACPENQVRDGPRALELILKTLKTQKAPDLELVESLAMALAEVGRFSEAAQVQGRMVEELERARRLDLAKLEVKNLALYQHGQACRLPWRDDDPIFSPQPGKMTLMVPEVSVMGRRPGAE